MQSQTALGKIRARSGLTTKNLAAALGRDATALNAIERGAEVASDKTVSALARRLRRPVREIRIALWTQRIAWLNQQLVNAREQRRQLEDDGGAAS